MTSHFEWKILKFHTDKLETEKCNSIFKLQLEELQLLQTERWRQKNFTAKLFFTIDSWDENPYIKHSLTNNSTFQKFSIPRHSVSIETHIYVQTKYERGWRIGKEEGLK